MNFLIQSPHAWRDVWQRPHHLAARFARAGHGVRYVQPRYLRWLAGERERFTRCVDETSAAGVDVRTATLVNGERLPPIRALNKRRLAVAMNLPVAGRASDRIAESASDHFSAARVLWLYNPHEGHLADSVAHDLLVYDIMDEYRGFPWAPPNIAAEEDELLRRADWVFAGTQALADAKKAQAGGRIECYLSGVDVEHFTRSPGAGSEGGEGSRRDEHGEASGRGDADLPSAIASLRTKYRRLLGYAGVLDLRMDQELIVASARRHRDWGFVLLGPERGDFARLHAEPNIHLPGQIPYAELPAWYHAWDVALIPFVENELTRHLNPTKILEYAAADLPVITRDLPDIRRFYAEGAFLYDSSEGFEAALQTVLGGQGETPGDSARIQAPPEVEAKMEIARRWAGERSWATIAGRMLDRVGGLLEK